MFGVCNILIYVSRKERKISKLPLFNKLIEEVLKEPDSWGFLGIKLDGRIRVFKTLSQNEFRKFIEEEQNTYAVFIFHGRMASAGKVDLRNAHPIIINNRYFMVHNGHMFSIPSTEDVSDTFLATVLLTGLIEQNLEKDAWKVFQKLSGFKIFVFKRGGKINVWVHDSSYYYYRIYKRNNIYIISKNISKGDYIDYLKFSIYNNSLSRIQKKKRVRYTTYYTSNGVRVYSYSINQYPSDIDEKRYSDDLRKWLEWEEEIRDFDVDC